MKRQVINLCLILQISTLVAQTPKKFSEFHCPAAQAHAIVRTTDKNYAKEQEEFEQYYQKYIQNLDNPHAKSGTVYTIPTVVHIVHNCAEIGSTNNPSDEQIRSIMDEVNLRLSHTHPTANSYSNPNYGADTEIELCLANVDPYGNYTTGIVRHADSEHHIGGYLALGQAYAANYRWDRTKYFNVFVATNITDASGVYLGGSSTDFIICDAAAFDPGLVMHEAGHYFSLRHTFDDCGNGNCLLEGDFVCDTPPKVGSGFNGGTCGSPANSCTSDEEDATTNNPYRSTDLGGMGDQADMVSNYMDYTSSCWDALTFGQKNRMRANIATKRMSLVNHAAIACGTVTLPSQDVVVLKITTSVADCADFFSSSVQFQNNGTSNLTNVTIQVQNANTTRSVNWTGNLAPSATATVNIPDIDLVSGVNTITATASAPNGSTDGFLDNNTACTTIAYASAKGLALPFSDDFSDCTLNSFYSLDNGDDVEWSLSNYSTPAGLSSCYDCYARVLGFATPAETTQFCLPKLDFSAANAPRIQFLLGHIPRYTFITNSLSMKVSSDCGTPSTVWTAAALELATNSPANYSPNSAYLYPTCSEMLELEVDLSAFANLTNVEICFEANGRWYSPLILDELNVSDAPISKQLAIKTMLNGPYNSNTGLMDANLRTSDEFPLTEPYSDMGYKFNSKDGGGETIDSSVLEQDNENAIVDWIVVELRSASTPATIVDARAALIQRDGDVVGVDGISPLDISTVTSGDYYIAIRHRNHLGAMSLVNIQ